MTWLAAVLALSAAQEPLDSARGERSCEALRQHARFSVHFERVELAKLVQTVSDATCRTFIVGDNVRGSVSLVGPEHTTLSLDADQFYAAFLAALDANGFLALKQGRFIRIVEKTVARQAPVPLVLPGSAFPAPDEVVSRVFKLQHVEVEPLRSVLAQFSGKGGDVIAAPPDLLIATDLVSNLQRLEALVGMLDVGKPGDVTRLLAVKHADAADLADKVTRALSPKVPKAGEAFSVMADDRTNRLLVAGAPAAVDRVEALVKDLDVEVPGDGRARVYRLKNADAKEVASALEGMAQVKAKPGAPAAGGVAGDVRITVNESLNALVIVASAGDYRSLVEVIEQLDVPIRQVFIETVIMEVNVERDSEFGLSFHGVAGTADNPIVFGSQPAGAPSSLSLASLASASGLLLGVQGPVLAEVSKLLGFDVASFGVALHATQTDSDVNVMSTPYILTTDNKEAEITVGQRVPFQQGTSPTQLGQLVASGNASTASTLANFGSSVTREKVELKLAVKPHIGDGDDIRLEVNQSAEEIAGSNSLGPITSTRTQKTTVVAKDDQTLVLGGIMQDRVVESVEKTPVLGDIPILGRLFRNTVKKKTKVNLLVFLTPHVIRGARDIDRLLGKKMEERTRMLELLYGDTAAYQPTIDYAHRRGPLAAMFHALDREERLPENGGKGGRDDRLIGPSGE